LIVSIDFIIPQGGWWRTDPSVRDRCRPCTKHRYCSYIRLSVTLQLL